MMPLRDTQDFVHFVSRVRVFNRVKQVLDRAVLANEMIISLSQMRSPVERLVSAFVYGAHSHPCALSSQVRLFPKDCVCLVDNTLLHRCQSSEFAVT